MKKTVKLCMAAMGLCAMALAGGAGAAGEAASAANWKKLPGSMYPRVFMDPEVAIEGGIKKTRYVLNFVTSPIASLGFHSMRVDAEFDCSEKKSRLVKTVFYTAEMGRGEPMGPADNSKMPWEQDLPGSVGEQIQTWICGPEGGLGN